MLKRIGYKGKLVAHGLRLIASTSMNETEFNPDVIEAALATLIKMTLAGIKPLELP